MVVVQKVILTLEAPMALVVHIMEISFISGLKAAVIILDQVEKRNMLIARNAPVI